MLPYRIPSLGLFREICQRSYRGTHRTLHSYLVYLYPPPSEPDNRFETEPGLQMHVDWCVFHRGKSRLSAFTNSTTLFLNLPSVVICNWMPGVQQRQVVQQCLEDIFLENIFLENIDEPLMLL